MKGEKIVVDTDVLVDHLLSSRSAGGLPSPSLFRRAVSRFFCYTTVFNAIELFSLCRTAGEVRAAEDAMHAIKLLGLNAKSAMNIAPLFRQLQGRPLRALVAGLCIESRLPLLTTSPGRYQGIAKLRVYNAARVLTSQRRRRSGKRRALRNRRRE